MPASPSSNAASANNNQTDSDFYTLLGLKPGASVQDIRRAYRDLSKLYHPDTTELESAIATVKFQSLNEAYATLSNPEKRLAYDYQIGYSRLSVMQPLKDLRNSGSSSQSMRGTASANEKAYDPTDSAYLSPSDRPLSPGELFALFILGITFIGCLILVFTIGLAKSELPITQVNNLPNNSQTETTSPKTISPGIISPSPQTTSPQPKSTQPKATQPKAKRPSFLPPTARKAPSLSPSHTNSTLPVI